MSPIVKDVEEFPVAADTADILGWASELASRADRVSNARYGIEGLLKEDFMFPIVAEIVDVTKAKLGFVIT